MSHDAFDSTKHLLCCVHKETNIPEVEAIIRLVTPQLERHWHQLVLASQHEIDDQLDDFDAGLVSADQSERDTLLHDLVLAVLLSLRRRVQAPVSLNATTLLRRSATSLMQDGAKAIDEPLNLARAPMLVPGAVADLLTLIRGHFELREPEIRQSLRALISQRDAAGVAIDREVARARLLRELGASTDSWLPFTVDQWAYRWFNIGSVVAARQAGALALIAVAVLDNRTSKFCRWVNGRVISMERAQRQLDRHVSAALAGDVRAIMANWPLLTFAESDGPAEFELKFATVGLPPYHGRCRTRTKLLRLRD